MPSAPAYSTATGLAVLDLWLPGAKASMLTALRYQPDQPTLLTRGWTSDAVTTGVLGSPVLSEDGTTVYVNGRDRRLWAIDAADGKAKWSVPLDFQPQTPPSSAPATDHRRWRSGHPTGGDQGLRRPRRRRGRRDDVTPLSTSSQAGAQCRLHRRRRWPL